MNSCNVVIYEVCWLHWHSQNTEALVMKLVSFHVWPLSFSSLLGQPKETVFFLCFLVSADLDNCYSTSVSPSLVHMHYLFDRVVQKTLIFCLYLQCFSLLSLASVRGHNYISTKANHKATHSQGSLQIIVFSLLDFNPLLWFFFVLIFF